jgi:hypothetical protein
MNVKHEYCYRDRQYGCPADHIITAEDLIDAGACGEEVDRFRALFPDGAKVTIRLAYERAADFDWEWAAEHLLSDASYTRFQDVTEPAERAAEQAYRVAHQTPREALLVAREAWHWATLGRPEDDRFRGPEWDEYVRVRKARSAVIDAAIMQARRALDSVRAFAFAALWLAERADNE